MAIFTNELWGGFFFKFIFIFIFYYFGKSNFSD